MSNLDLARAVRLSPTPTLRRARALRVAVRDSDEYERLYTTCIAALPGVRKARSQIAMKTIRPGLSLPVT